jgi:glycosyltransferase involved in cell wall biosynthesis
MTPPAPAATRTICLYNPISRQGHLDSYARLYARAFLELGHRVLLVAETDAGAPGYVARTCPQHAAAFSFTAFADVDEVAGLRREGLPAHRRALLVWRAEGPGGIAGRLLGLPRRLLWRMLPEAARRALPQLAPGPRRLGLRPLVARIAAAGARAGSLPDLVFILYLDLMSEAAGEVAALDGPGGLPWAGILFHPRAAADEAYFDSARARGGLFLVPAALARYAERRPRLAFSVAPDVADLELAPTPHALAQAMRTQAAGRTIVLAIGTVTPHKGTETLLRVIREADREKFFFAVIGAVMWPSFGPFEGELRAFYQAPPANVLVHDGYVEDEPDYNTLIVASDIVYAVYQGFGSSSNSLTKSAGFGRPILVAQGTLMGARVQEAGIGAVAMEGDVASILAGLAMLAAAPRDSFDFAGYGSRHSLAALKRVLDGAVGQWCAAPSASAAVPS